MAIINNTQDKGLQFLRVGGLNQSVSPHVLPAPDFSFLHALYPAQEGMLERLPGILLKGQAGDGSAAIWQIFQPNDGTDNLIVQTSDGTERIFTLSELFGRTIVSDLTYTPTQDDEDMPTAIILQDASNGTDGGSIGASSNTWYVRELTSNPLNEDSIVVAFTSGASGSFELAPGTYRVRGFVSAAFTIDQDNSGADTVVVGFQAALVNTTDSATTSTGSPAQHSLTRTNAASSEFTWGPVTIYSYFDDTFTIATTNKVFQIQNAYIATSTDGSTITKVTGKASGVSTALNGAAVRQPYMRIVISKIS